MIIDVGIAGRLHRYTSSSILHLRKLVEVSSHSTGNAHILKVSKSIIACA